METFEQFKQIIKSVSKARDKEGKKIFYNRKKKKKN